MTTLIVRCRLPWTLLLVAAVGLVTFGTSAPLPAAAPPVVPPKLDASRIINRSLGFLRDREPEMTEVEYALYERMIPIVESDPAMALTLLETMLDDAQKESAAFEFVLGNVYHRLQRWEEAEQRFRSAVEQHPTFQRAWVSLGSVYYARGRYREAAPCLSRAIALGDREASTFGLLGSALRHAGNVFAAESAYKQAMTSEPANPDWTNGLLEIYVATEQYAPAAALARELVHLHPADPRHWTLYTSLLVRLGRPLEAIAALQLAAELELATPALFQLLGELCAEEELYAEAAAAFARAEVGPTGPLALDLARALMAQERWEVVEPLARQPREGKSAAEQAEWAVVRAQLARQRGDAEAERTELTTAARLDPLNGRVLLALGRAEVAAEAFAAAQLHFEHATQVAEHAFAAHVELAQLHVQQRQLRQALKHAQEAWALRPGPELQDFLTRIQTLVNHENPAPSS